MKRIPLPDHVVARIRDMHGGKERGHHAWSHPVDMLETMRPIQHLLHDRNAVTYANILHDVIYDTHRKDNEERSAQFAEEILAGHAPEETIRHTARMIRASAGHALQEELSPNDASDTSYFLDLDLSILGAEQARFDAYEAGIRHEYQHVPWEIYASERMKILTKFIQRKHLFMTDWGRASFEARARRNITRSISRLRLAA